MLEDRKNIDKLFSDALLNFEASPPAYVWSGINEGLQKKKAVRFWSMARNVAASVLIMVSFFAGYWYTNWRLSKQIASYKYDLEKYASNNAVRENVLPSIYNKDKFSMKFSSVQKPFSFLSNQTANHITPLIENIISYDMSENYVVPVSTKINRNKISAIKFLSVKKYLLSENELQSIPKFISTVSKATVLHSNESKKSNSKNNFKIDTLMRYQPGASPFLVKAKTKKINHWAVGGQVSPIYNYRDAFEKNNNTNDNSVANEKYFNSNENAMVTIAGGLNLKYNMSSRWSVQTGIYYSKTGQITNNVYTYGTLESVESTSKLITSAGIVNAPGVNTNSKGIPIAMRSNTLDNLNANASLIQNFEYVELPFVFRYRAIDRNVGLHFLCGMNTGLLVSNNVFLETETNKDWIGQTEGVRKINYNAIIGFGLEYMLLNKISISIEPTYRHSIVPINSDQFIRSYPYSFGIFTGVSYSF